MDIVKHNQITWDIQSSQASSRWVQPVISAEIAAARTGSWQVILTPHKPVPAHWFGGLKNKDVLGFASGGGQQVPLFAAAGANVNSFDNSPEELGKDRLIAERDGLNIVYEQGDMADLQRFSDASFDLTFHPVAHVFCADILPVSQHCARILRSGRLLLNGFMSPDFYLFDHDTIKQGGPLLVRFALPFADTEQTSYEQNMARQRDQQPKAR